MATDLTLVIGNKNYSSWSMRPWIALRGAGIEFRERMLKFESQDWRDHIGRLAPSGTVPVLWEDEPGSGFATWETIAILERAHELYPSTGVWPAGAQARARARKTNPRARLVLTGCYVQMAPQSILDLTDQPLCLVGNGNKHLVVSSALAESSCDLTVLMDNVGRKKEITPLPVTRFPDRTRAFLRIQDGCNNFCSYCIVPFIRGRSRSLPLAQVLEQAAVFAGQGYLEIVITGINVGKYGLELAEGENLVSLLARLCRNFPGIRFRLSSVEPTEVDDPLLDLLAGHANFMSHELVGPGLDLGHGLVEER